MGRLKPVLKLWILCNDIIMIMAGTYSMSITHICLVLSHLSLLCYITSSVPLPNLSLTFVTLYLESYCASRILHLFLCNILLLHCTVPSSSYPPSCLPSAKVLDAEAGDIALLHPTYHCFTLPHWNRCYITPQHVCILCSKRIRHQPTVATRDQHHTPPCVRWTLEQ